MLFKSLPIILSMLFILSACGMQEKRSEEAVVLKIDTASMLKGRTITSTVSIDNSEKAAIAQ